MTLDILICTIDAGIERVADVLMPPRPDVHYVVSAQWTDARWADTLPDALAGRADVTVAHLEGRGLSRNRNHALTLATADVVVIADDDCRYSEADMERIKAAYASHPEAEIIHFEARDLNGRPLHPYPAPFVSSVELTFKRTVRVRFDERFGLGSGKFCDGEEQVWMKDAANAGHTIIFEPQPIVTTPGGTTGSRFADCPELQISKGAMFRYVYGTPNALWRTCKESAWWMTRRSANPFPILYNMMKGMIFLNRR